MIVFLDVDGTLLPGASAESRFVAWLIGQGEIRPSQIARASTRVALLGVSRQTLIGARGYLAGLSAERAAALGSRFVSERLIADVRLDVLAHLRRSFGAGAAIALLTAVVDVLATPLAAQIGAAHALATRLAIADGRIAHWPDRAAPYGPGKLRAAQRLCARFGERLADCVAYADSWSDLPLLEAVGTAVVVAPRRDLRRIAEDRGWEILQPRPPSPALRRRMAAP